MCVCVCYVYFLQSLLSFTVVAARKDDRYVCVLFSPCYNILSCLSFGHRKSHLFNCTLTNMRTLNFFKISLRTNQKL